MRKTLLERFFEKVDKRPDGCWIWTGARFQGLDKTKQQYACFNRGLAHRFAYTHLVGPIPEGLVIDHLCRVRHCVNPDHLEPVTQKENLRRGRHAGREMTHCREGHPFEGPNLMWIRAHGAPRRRCRACALRRQRKFRESHRSPSPESSGLGGK